MIDLENYWNNLDSKLKVLLENGIVKLPSLNILNLDSLAENINKEVGPLTFKENTFNHKKLLKELEVDKFLTPKLLNISKKFFNYKGDISNQYHIARKVNPGDTNEQFRAHFDSHIFTIVFPIKIPKAQDNDFAGELIYFPNIRRLPKNELINLLGKIYYKIYASKNGIKKLAKLHSQKVENFINLEPIIFLGKTTLHTNYPVSLNCSSYRLTLLSHFFDNSSKYSMGRLLRFIRKR